MWKFDNFSFACKVQRIVDGVRQLSRSLEDFGWNRSGRRSIEQIRAFDNFARDVNKRRDCAAGSAALHVTATASRGRLTS